jgi:hypothetical protein
MIGRSPWLQSVHVETNAGPGAKLDVTLSAAGPNSMTGTVVPATAGTSGRTDAAPHHTETPAFAGETRSAA